MKNSGFKVIVGVLCTLILILVGVIIFLLTGTGEKVSEKTPVTTVSDKQPIVVDTVKPAKTEIAKTPESGGTGRKLVRSGFEFTIPDDFGVLFSDEIGIIIYMNDIFQMKIAVLEEDSNRFAEYKENPETLTEKAVAAGGVITDACKCVNFKGMDIMSFRVDLMGDDTAVMRVHLDEGHSFAGQMVLFSDTLTEEDCLNIFAQIAESALATDKPDTTEEEYFNSVSVINVGTATEEATLDTPSVKVTYKVPEGFFSVQEETYVNDEKTYFSDSYMTNSFDSVDVRIQQYAGGAKQMIDESYSFEGGEESTITLGDRVFYCVSMVEEPKREDDDPIYRMLIVSDIAKDDWVYVISTFTGRVYTAGELTEFMQILVK